MGELKSDQKVNEKILEKCVVARDIGEKEGKITVYFPEKGEYTLTIFVNDPKADVNTYTPVWKYALTSEKGFSGVSGLPNLEKVAVGKHGKFSACGLTQLGSVDDPFIRIEGHEFQLNYSTKIPLKLSTKLHYTNSNGKEDDMSKYVLRQWIPKENKVNYI